MFHTSTPDARWYVTNARIYDSDLFFFLQIPYLKKMFTAFIWEVETGEMVTTEINKIQDKVYFDFRQM
jgi:hypothetical protein